MSEMQKQLGVEMPAAHYDKSYAKDEHRLEHYSRTQYWGLWATIIDRLRMQNARRILEIGCGSGQLAHAIRDARLAEGYLGIDFSKVAIEQAKKVNPGWNFRCADVFQDRALEEERYDIVLSTEFLEHVNEDLAVIGRIRPGTMVIASVPNFPWKDHVRYFGRADEVHARYAPFFEKLYVVAIRTQKSGATHFLMQGPRNDRAV